MDDFLVREKLRAYVTDGEPPMTLTSAGLLAKGARQGALRLGAGLGAGTTVTALALVAALIYLPANQSQPALSGEAACLGRVPIVPGATSDVTADPLATGSAAPLPPVSSEQLAQVSCSLVDKVTAMLPGRRFLPSNWRGAPPFQTLEYEGGLRVSARTATGSFGVLIVPLTTASSTPPDWQGRLETLPDGTTVAITTDFGMFGDKGSRMITVQRRTQGTVILVMADNVRTVRPEVDAGGDPILTEDQLTQIAAMPQLEVFG